MELLLNGVLIPAPPPLRLEVQSLPDWNLIKDVRVIENMLSSEQEFEIHDYCHNGIQPDIEPHMRKIVADWMAEVCDDQQCSPEVFCLAINYMDRFLSQVTISKCDLQLAASVCLLLASKFCEVIPFTTDRLAMYTDHSVTVEQLVEWEVTVLNGLSWEMSSITTHSFLEILIHSIQFPHKLNMSDIRRQAELLLTLTATDYCFLQLRPSTMVAGALLIACASFSPIHDLLKSLSSCIHECQQNIVYISLLFKKFTTGVTSNNQINLSYIPPLITEEQVKLSYINQFKRKEEDCISYLPPYANQEEANLSFLPSFIKQEEVNVAYIPPCGNKEDKNLSYLPSLCKEEREYMSYLPQFVIKEEMNVSCLPPFGPSLIRKEDSMVPSVLPPFYTVSALFSTISNDNSCYMPFMI